MPEPRQIGEIGCGPAEASLTRGAEKEEPRTKNYKLKTENCKRKLRHEPLRPAHLHDAQTIVCSDFLLHSIQMVFHRLLRPTEPIGDLLVREPLGYRWDQLLFSPR